MADFLALNRDGRRLINTALPEWCTWPPPEQVIAILLGTAGSADETVMAVTPVDGATEARVLGEFFEGRVERFKRVQMSEISDEDAAEMTHVARGALYIPES